ncbi:MAG: uracil-DNA glycosylase [Deltaproteobacteria bacterium]|nr:uracil-DNA glycosylase [Deltaproteobacteria bacterium]
MTDTRSALLSAVHQQFCALERMGLTMVPRSPSSTPGPMQDRCAQAAVPESLAQIRADLGACQRCPLCQGRTQIVFGVGNPQAALMFVGEGPGADEDLQGEPFVGRAGQLLDKIIQAMGLQRSEVYIGNIVKCRPPGNRAPLPNEAETCLPFLMRQIAAIQPKVIVTLGSIATQYLLGDASIKITRVRGMVRTWHGTALMPTYHPAFLLRNPAMKRAVWEDMQKVMGLLGGSSPGRSKPTAPYCT